MPTRGESTLKHGRFARETIALWVDLCVPVSHYVYIYSSSFHRADILRCLYRLDSYDQDLTTILTPPSVLSTQSQAVMTELVMSGPNDPMASLIELESIYIAFCGCFNDLVMLSSSERMPVQSFVDSVGCGEMWQAILRRVPERDDYVECLLDYLNNGAPAAVTPEEAEEALQLSLRILTDDGLQLLDIKRKLGNAMYVAMSPMRMSAHTKMWRYRSQHDGDALDQYMQGTAASNDKWDHCMNRMNELDQSMRSEFVAWTQMQTAGVDQQTMKKREEGYTRSQQRYTVERLLLDVEQAEIVAEARDIRLYLKANLGTWRPSLN